MLKILGLIALIAILFGVSLSSAVGILIKIILWIVGIFIALAIFSTISDKIGLRKTIGIPLSVIALIILIYSFGSGGSQESYDTQYNFCIELLQERIESRKDSRYYSKPYTNSEIKEEELKCKESANKAKENKESAQNFIGVIGFFGIIGGLSIAFGGGQKKTEKPKDQKSAT